MTDFLSNANTYFDFLPFPALLACRDTAGSWHAAYLNPAAKELLKDRSSMLFQAIGPALARGESGWHGTLCDRELTALFSACPQDLRFISLYDITDEQQRQQEQVEAAQAALRSALDAANAANRAKTDFLSNMSHDIRTPLNAIIGMTTIAQSHMDNPERVQDCLEKIDISSRHLLAIINDILDMSRIESGKMTVNAEPFSMADFIHSILTLFQPQAEKKHQRVKLDFTGIRHEQVRGDELRIQQVLLNILTNAVKFTPEEGIITLRIRETSAVGNDEHNYAYYEFTVQDSGIGMSPEFLEKLFLPFERDKSVSRIQGTGLGMTITYNLVKMMNGEILVESQPGEGTRFIVTLPLEQELQTAEPALEALRGRRVLAVEAEPSALEHLCEICEDLGLYCDTADCAWKALDLASQAHMEGQDYFAILLAWRLPVVDGVQLCRELRTALGSNVPILLMSRYEWTLSADEMHKYGITAFIPKPMFHSRLSETLYAYTPEGKAAGEAAGDEQEESFEGFHILLVEDNEINREIGIELIHMLGASVECAEDGQQALELFRDTPAGRFDLIFMDIQMPVMDGLAATRAIRALPRQDSRTIPIVAMSANAFVEDIQACLQAGMDAHVPKPVNLHSLTDAMRQFLLSGAPGRKEASL